jgi:putative molybdopterin biosynthesis protein
MSHLTEYLYQEIAESIRRRIASGELKAGDRLPPVREMAERWSCNNGTVSRAYGLLAEEGLVTAHRGSGTQVAANTLQAQSPTWQWANLVNRAEQYLLEALSSGYEPAQISAALVTAVARWQTMQQEEGELPLQDETRSAPALRFAGSHDLVVEMLVQRLQAADPSLAIDVSYNGSLGGLMALARGEANVAGTHLWDEETDCYNEPFVRRILPGRRVELMTLVHRRQGLIVAPGNPLQLNGLDDLGRSGVRFINRQPGSGTRVWLDAQLKAAGIDPAQISGFEQEATTHMQVARAIAGGEADVGLGIHAAAAAFDLAFVPLMEERYDLVFTAETWQLAGAKALRDIVSSVSFNEAVSALGGYDTRESGQVRRL